MSNRDQLARLAHDWVRQGWQAGRDEMVDELHALDFVDRSPDGRADDREGFKEGIRDLFRAFPDFYAVVEDLVIDEAHEKVAVRWSAQGTHSADFLGVPPTGRIIEFAGIEIIRVREGKIVERWGEWNGADILDQLTR